MHSFVFISSLFHTHLSGAVGNSTVRILVCLILWLTVCEFILWTSQYKINFMLILQCAALHCSVNPKEMPLQGKTSSWRHKQIVEIGLIFTRLTLVLELLLFFWDVNSKSEAHLKFGFTNWVQQTYFEKMKTGNLDTQNEYTNLNFAFNQTPIKKEKDDHPL